MSEANTGMIDSGAPDQSAAPDVSNPAPMSDNPTPDLGDGGEPAPAPVFTPNYKYKVKDKEYEVEDWARGIAKDEETNKKLLRMFERSTGLDEVISGRDQLKMQLQQIEPKLREYDQVSKSLNEISHLFNTGDLDGFFQRLQIPEATIINWLRAKHQQSQLAPEVQQQLENARQAQRQMYNQNQELENLRAQTSQFDKQQRLSALDANIASKAGVLATKFNEINGGNPEAFRNYVIVKGQFMSQQFEREATLEEVLEQCQKEFGPMLGQAAPTPNAPAASLSASGNPAPPVIPAVKAGSQSPVRQPIKSLEEMRKRAQEI